MKILAYYLMQFVLHWSALLRAIILTMGALWLPLEAFEGLTNEDTTLSYTTFLILSLAAGFCVFVFDGLYFSGFFKKQVLITSNMADTVVRIEFGDFFTQSGVKAVAVNDFFDSSVGGDGISRKSVHGRVIEEIWAGDTKNWKSQISEQLKTLKPEKVSRARGLKMRYPIGSTAVGSVSGSKFLFYALSTTDVDSGQTLATAADLLTALSGLLECARSECDQEPLVLPLAGSGLSRTGIKLNIVVDLLLCAIFEATKKAKVTNEIVIVLPIEQAWRFNLQTYTRDWAEA